METIHIIYNFLCVYVCVTSVLFKFSHDALAWQHAQPDPIEIQRQQENRRRAIARKRAKDQLRPRSPDPVDGRKHIDVQTELYLEELSDRVEEADVECQTDAFLDRPPSPMFVPAKTGIDIATQILEGDVSCLCCSYSLFPVVFGFFLQFRIIWLFKLCSMAQICLPCSYFNGWET